MDVDLKDAKGRTLTVHDMDPADELDLYEACADQSTNAAWLAEAKAIAGDLLIERMAARKPGNNEGGQHMGKEMEQDHRTLVEVRLRDGRTVRYRGTPAEPVLCQTIAEDGGAQVWRLVVYGAEELCHA